MKLCIKWILVAFFSVSQKVIDYVSWRCWTGTRPIFVEPRFSQTKWLASGNENGCFTPRFSRTYKVICCTYILLSKLTCKPIGSYVTSFRYSLTLTMHRRLYLLPSFTFYKSLCVIWIPLNNAIGCHIIFPTTPHPIDTLMSFLNSKLL